MQALPNGNRFVGWGGEPNLTEFSPDGRVVFDAALAAPDTSYRAFRFPWNAAPPGRPAVATAAAAGGKLTVYASWNGATDIARWRILAGPSPNGLKPVAEASRTGFESSASLFTRATYLDVEAQARSGRVLGSSRAVKRGGGGRLSRASCAGLQRRCHAHAFRHGHAATLVERGVPWRKAVVQAELRAGGR
jgi:hypothetical protein